MFLALLGGTIGSLFGWLWLSRRVGKSNAYLLAAAISILAFALMSVADSPSGWNAALILTAIAGVGFGGLQLLPFAMLTDVIHAARENGRDCAGSFTGLWTAVEKCGLAIGPVVIALFLQLGRFQSGAVTQDAGAITAIRNAVSLGPTLLILASIAPLFVYSARSRAAAILTNATRAAA